MSEEMTRCDIDKLDELITEAQDAFFVNDLDRTISVCRDAMRISMSVQEIFELISISYQMKGEHLAAIESAYQWIEKFGPTIKNLRVLLECNFLLADISLMETTIQRLINYYAANQERDDGGVTRMCESLLAFAAAMAADLGLHVGAAIDVAQQAERNSRIELLYGYAQKCVGDQEEGEAVLRDVVARHDDDDGLAGALLVLYLLESGSRTEAVELLESLLHDEDMLNKRPLREIAPYVKGLPYPPEERPSKYSSIFIKRRMDLYGEASE